MEIKKSDKANLDLHRSTGFLLGLVFALALLFAAFEYTSRPSDLQEDDSMLDDMSDDLEMTAAMNTKDMVSAAPAPASKALTQNVKEVDKTQNADKVAPITSKLVIGDGQGLAKQANVTEAIPETSALPQDTAAVLRTVEQLAQQQEIQGKVVVSFIINKDGSIASPRIVTSADPILDREAMRVVKMMPRWKPGMEDGKPCRTMFAIPVNFQL